MLNFITRYFKHPPARAELAEKDVRRLYPRYRWQVLSATFIGYSVFYLVRNNLSTVAKDVGA